MMREEDISLILIIISFIFGMLFMGIIVEPFATRDRLQELGDAICLEQWNTTYDWYDLSKSKLHCKEPATGKHYDGIYVVVGDDDI